MLVSRLLLVAHKLIYRVYRRSLVTAPSVKTKFVANETKNKL